MEHFEQLRQAGLFRMRVPRYASYPPASRFLPAEGRLHQRSWLNALRPGAALSLYVHVPYCARLCWFCACRTQTAESRSAVDAYLGVVCEEIALLRAELPSEVTVSRLHLGGGTPTILEPRGLSRLVETVQDAFATGPLPEFSVEIDTTVMTDALATNLMELGMTRAVIGVQDFDPAVQAAIGRPQDFTAMLQVIDSLREAGRPQLDIELLYGLPAQTQSSIAESTQQVLALEPDRVALCEYAHVPHLAKRQVLVDTRRLPTAESAYRLSQVARRMLLADGFEAVGVDHFVRPGDALIAARREGRLMRDFQGYSDTATHALIGLGASAISRFPQGYVQNLSATSAYVQAVGEGRLPADRGYSFAEHDLAISCMIEMLMCGFRIDLSDLSHRFASSRAAIERAVEAVCRRFEAHVTVTAETLVLHSAAHPLARLIAQVIDTAAGSGARDLAGFRPA